MRIAASFGVRVAAWVASPLDARQRLGHQIMTFAQTVRDRTLIAFRTLIACIQVVLDPEHFL
jgi:hypothetical protein